LWGGVGGVAKRVPRYVNSWMCMEAARMREVSKVKRWMVRKAIMLMCGLMDVARLV
jgi:hypothetical protein